jgi:hypothetical protein
MIGIARPNVNAIAARTEPRPKNEIFIESTSRFKGGIGEKSGDSACFTPISPTVALRSILDRSSYPSIGARAEALGIRKGFRDVGDERLIARVMPPSSTLCWVGCTKRCLLLEECPITLMPE